MYLQQTSCRWWEQHGRVRGFAGQFHPCYPNRTRMFCSRDGRALVLTLKCPWSIKKKKNSLNLYLFICINCNFYLRGPYSSYGDGKEPRPRSRSPAYGRDGREPRDSHEGRDSGREPRLGRHSRDHEYRYRSSESRDKDLRSDPRDSGYRWPLITNARQHS